MEVEHLNEQIVKSMNEFDQNLTSDEAKEQVNVTFTPSFLFQSK